MKSLRELIIPQPFIALFGSGPSIEELTQEDLEMIKAHAFVITLNYAPIQLKGHLNIWSDRNVSDFLETHYLHHPKECLLLAQEGRVGASLQGKVDYWFNRKAEKLQGNFTIVWALQLLKIYFPGKRILLFGVDLYVEKKEKLKWYDRYTDFDRKRRGTQYKAEPKLQQCGTELTRLIPPENIYNCNPKSRLHHFQKKNWKDVFKLKILHFASSPLAGAPVHLSQILNRYTLCESKSILLHPFLHQDLINLKWDYDEVKPNISQLEEAYAWADLVHYHGRPPHRMVHGKPNVLQYHSEPQGYKPGITHAEFNDRKLVVAQYQPRFYADAYIVPNLIDIWDDRFRPGNKSSDRIRIFYSWASETKTRFGNKGSKETIGILKRIQQAFPNEVEIEILHNAPYTQCLAAKQKAHICIDECITGSYHLQSLEGCAIGAVTFNNTDDTTFSFMQHTSGCPNHPFFKTNLAHLPEGIRQLIRNRDILQEKGLKSRSWMETNWDPRKLIFRYIHAYFNIVFHNKIENRKPTLHLTGKQSKPQNVNGKTTMTKVNGTTLVPKIIKPGTSKAYGNPIPPEQSIVNLHQQFCGRDIYIFGTGPSLMKQNAENFRDKICLGINFAFEVLPVMTYVMVHDVETYEIIRKIIDNRKLILSETLVNQSSTLPGHGHLPHRIPVQNDQAWIYPIQDPYEKNINNKKLDLQKEASIYTWSTTTHSAIHLAAYMGAKNIYLIGVDYMPYPNGKMHFDTRHSTTYALQKWNKNLKHSQGDEWLQKKLAENGINLKNMSLLNVDTPVKQPAKQSHVDGTFSGSYVNGIGKALNVSKSEDRSMLLTQLFGCPLIGTFNIRTTENTDHIAPVIVQDIHKFNFVRISLPDGQYRYGWCYRFVGSSQKANILEVYSKEKLPDAFKMNELKIDFFSRWPPEKILEWQKGKYWFQGFSWLPEQRADSLLLWNYMKNEDYQHKSVLDFGTHYGYFAFQASRKGATVEAIDQDPKNIKMASTINEHIEQQDIIFSIGNKLPDRTYDYIFELSVYHWIDEHYADLFIHLEELKKRCKTLFLELINPPMKGKLSQREVDEIAGGEKLIHYRHKVRRTRTLYKIAGYLK
ncbi:MAG TPA: hypothetical protein VGK46_10755 [Saprospiraceae bacterium]